MYKNTKNKAIWHKLLHLSKEFYSLKPWEKFRPNDIFGIQDPKSNQFYYCVIESTENNTHNLIAYKGIKGLIPHLDAINGSIFDHIFQYEQNFLLVNFVKKKHLFEEDLYLLKNSPEDYPRNFLKPTFRDYSSGLLPSFISEQQAETLCHILKQTISIVKAFVLDSKILVDNEKQYLFYTHIPIKDETGRVTSWEARFVDPMEVEEAVSDGKTIKMVSDLVLAPLKGLTRTEDKLFFDTIWLPRPIKEGTDDRAYFPRQMIWNNLKDGNMYIHPEDNGIIKHSFDFNQDFEAYFINKIQSIGFLPSSVHVCSDEHYELLHPYFKPLGIEVEVEESLIELSGIMYNMFLDLFEKSNYYEEDN